jgi:hypothetical protein
LAAVTGKREEKLIQTCGNQRKYVYNGCCLSVFNRSVQADSRVLGVPGGGIQGWFRTGGMELAAA